MTEWVGSRQEGLEGDNKLKRCQLYLMDHAFDFSFRNLLESMLVRGPHIPSLFLHTRPCNDLVITFRYSIIPMLVVKLVKSCDLSLGIDFKPDAHVCNEFFSSSFDSNFPIWPHNVIGEATTPDQLCPRTGRYDLDSLDNVSLLDALCPKSFLFKQSGR